MRSLPLTATLAVLAAAALAPSTASARTENLIGVDTKNRLVTFKSTSATKVKTKAIKGLPMGETIVGLDRRPADGVVFALGLTSRLYTLDRATAVATPVGTGTFSTPLNGTNFGFDFNPMVDRIRITSNFTQNLRLVPDTGAVAMNDGALNYAEGDVNAGKVAAISGSAYTNPVRMAMSTQLFDIDVNQDVLALQDPPNAGGLKTVGPLLQGDIQSPVAFDISSIGNAYAALRQKGRRGSTLSTVVLSTGRANFLSVIGSRKRPLTLRALTVVE